MGIQGLNPFLKEYAPSAFRRVKVSLFKGKCIAIDSPLLLFAKFSTTFSSFVTTRMKSDDLLSEVLPDSVRLEIRNLTADRISSFVKELYSLGITPIFVFDGTSVPEKTSGARQRRQARREAIDTKIQTLRNEINSVEPIFRKPADMVALRSLMAQIPPIRPQEDIPWFKSLIGTFGAKTITAPDEAEKMCAVLTKHGIAAASWTTDTDSYAFGATIVINGFDEETRPFAVTDEDGNFQSKRPAPTHFSTVVVPMITKSLDINLSQFIDLCIMFGCDFNSRVKGLGPVTAWKLFKAARERNPNANRLIEYIAEQSGLDLTELNSERCREIFCHGSEIESCLEEANKMNFTIDIQSIEQSSVLESALLGCLGKTPPTRVKIRS